MAVTLKPPGLNRLFQSQAISRKSSKDDARLAAFRTGRNESWFASSWLWRKGLNHILAHHAAMAEEVSPMLLSMVQMLAEAPEEQRLAMLETRLREFAAMPDAQRVQAMTQMVKAVGTLPSQKAIRLAKSRIDCLCDKFDGAGRKTLMGTHMMALMALPMEAMKKDLEAMFAAMPQLSESNRMTAMQTMKALMMEMPADKQAAMMQMLPEEARKILAM